MQRSFQNGRPIAETLRTLRFCDPIARTMDKKTKQSARVGAGRRAPPAATATGLIQDTCGREERAKTTLVTLRPLDQQRTVGTFPSNLVLIIRSSMPRNLIQDHRLKVPRAARSMHGRGSGVKSTCRAFDSHGTEPNKAGPQGSSEAFPCGRRTSSDSSVGFR